MHLAAQAENVYALTYFRDRGISINDLDDEKCTPLHWAVISKQVDSIYFLLEWSCDVNAQNNRGQTALHLMIRESENFDMIQTYLRFLINGADRLLIDQDGRTARDLIDEYVNNEKIKNELSFQLVSLYNIYFLQSKQRESCEGLFALM